MVSVKLPFFSSRPTPSLFAALLLIATLWVFTPCNGFAYVVEAKYTESAHGNFTYGVLRRAGTSSADYAQGNCAHCHEQHASIDGNSHTPYQFGLFAPNNPISQTDNFCFQCHCDVVSSIQSNMVPNYDYGRTFGGGPEMSDNIKDAFNFGPPNRAWTTGSSHNLRYIRNGIQGIPEGDWVTSATNACRVCHDPHTAQRNKDVVASSHGGVLTALYHPASLLQNPPQPRNLWGDEGDTPNRELQDEVATGTYYQAPFYYPAPSGYPVTGNYEPAGNTIGDGSNMPNYNRFCLGCHKYNIPNSLTDADPNTIGGRALFVIDWSFSGNQHGEKPGSPNTDPCVYGYLKSPFNDTSENYVLACTDCHEPHGSQSAFLLRTVVNGKQVSPVKQWLGTMESASTWEFCTACHHLYTPCGPHDCDDIPGDGNNDHLLSCQEFGCAYCHDHSRVDF